MEMDMDMEERILQQDIQSILSEEIHWEKLREKTVLLTGASGMIGRYLMSVLLELNDRGWGMELYGLVRNARKLPEEFQGKIHVLQQSVVDPIETDIPFDYILHTASPASPLIMREDPVGTIAANALGAWNTLRLAKESGSSGYLFLSSREIYGQPLENQDVFTEDTYGFVDPLDPRSCYPEGKKAAETMCACFHKQYGLNVKIVRLAHTFGPGMSVDDGRVQADFLRDVISGRDITLKSQGLPVRTYSYVRDAASGIFYILLNAPKEELAYNISSEEATVSIRGLAEAMVAAFPERELSLRFDIPESQENSGTAPFTKGILSSEKLMGLGWRPRTTLKEGIRRTVAYLEEENKK